jgi:hypothetical protein
MTIAQSFATAPAAAKNNRAILSLTEKNTDFSKLVRLVVTRLLSSGGRNARRGRMLTIAARRPRMTIAQSFATATAAPKNNRAILSSTEKNTDFSKLVHLVAKKLAKGNALLAPRAARTRRFATRPSRTPTAT